MKELVAIPILVIFTFATTASGVSLGINKKSPSNCVYVTVDYNIKPSVMGKAQMGKGDNPVYGGINEIGNKLKPRAKGKVVKEVCWFKLDKKPTTKQAIKRLEEKGYLAADLWELHALWLHCRDLIGPIDQMEYRCLNLRDDIIGLVALGSIWPHHMDSKPVRPVMGEEDSTRTLDVVGERKQWDDKYLFAAVRK